MAAALTMILLLQLLFLASQAFGFSHREHHKQSFFDEDRLEEQLEELNQSLRKSSRASNEKSIFKFHSPKKDYEPSEFVRKPRHKVQDSLSSCSDVMETKILSKLEQVFLALKLQKHQNKIRNGELNTERDALIKERKAGLEKIKKYMEDFTPEMKKTVAKSNEVTFNCDLSGVFDGKKCCLCF